MNYYGKREFPQPPKLVLVKTKSATAIAAKPAIPAAPSKTLLAGGWPTLEAAIADLEKRVAALEAVKKTS
jgi:hypothetical protein